MRSPRTENGFTLVELIAVIVVLAVLAGVAVPKYFDMSERAKVSSVAGSMRVVRNALLQYRMNFGEWPPDGITGQTIPELNPFLTDPNWANPIGSVGRFNWDGPPGHAGIEAISITPMVTPSDPTADPFWLQIDTIVDDGNLSTGLWRWASDNRYHWYFQ